jgi:diguanylate cyclase (GGDEF)-like protein
MTKRLWRLVAVAVALVVAADVGVASVVEFPRATGIALILAAVFLVLLVMWQIERMAGLRERAARAEQELAATSSNLEHAEAIDPVTRLASRGRFFEILQQEFRRSLRYRRPLSCMLLDLDRFSAINEEYGQHFGDIVLGQFGAIVGRGLRDSDLAARYEGEAFALLLPETPPEQAGVVAERIRGRLKGHVFSNGVSACSLSASFGIAGLPDARVLRTDDLVRLAAQALEEAKRRGRDRVVIDLPAGPTGSGSAAEHQAISQSGGPVSPSPAETA